MGMTMSITITIAVATVSVINKNEICVPENRYLGLGANTV